MKDHFSPSEQKVLKILGRRRMKIMDITRAMHHGKKPPLGANNSVAMMIRRINSKCDYYSLSWLIDGRGSGRSGRLVWRAKRG